MRWLPVLTLLALGCSEAPPSLDAGQDGARPDLCVCPDVPPVEDVVAVADASATDAVDAAVGVDAVDAVAVADVPDAGELPDIVITFDIPRPPEDVQDASAPSDTPDVTAVADVGPQDAGPQVFPLDPPPGATEVRVLFWPTCASADGGACGTAPVTMVRSGTCARTGSRLNFTFNVGYEITGLFTDYRNTTGASIAVVGGGATQGRDFVIEAGAVSAGRQSFRVSFSAPATGSVGGVTGVPGRTVDPARGDIWLLGCEVR